MFSKKVCAKCNLKNHFQSRHCSRCGQPHTHAAIVSKKICSSFFALALLIVSGAAYGANNYLSKSRTKSSIQNFIEPKTVVTPKTQEGQDQTSLDPTTENISTTKSTTDSKSENTTKIRTAPPSTPAATSQPVTPTITPPATVTTAPDDWYENCIADVQATTKNFQDGWNSYYADALARHNQDLDQLAALYSSQGLGSSSFYQAAVTSSNNSFESSMDLAYGGFWKQMIDATTKYPCGTGKLVR